MLRGHLNWWRQKIVDEDASMLVADCAPTALWAAQGMKAEGWEIETLSVGTGYGLPPARLPQFPVLLPDYDRRVTDEAAMLATLNRLAV